MNKSAMRRQSSVRIWCVHMNTDIGMLSRNAIYRCECAPHQMTQARGLMRERTWCSCSGTAEHTREAHHAGRKRSIPLMHKTSLASSTRSKCTNCGEEVIPVTVERRDSLELAQRPNRKSDPRLPTESRRQSEFSKHVSSGYHTPPQRFDGNTEDDVVPPQ